MTTYLSADRLVPGFVFYIHHTYEVTNTFMWILLSHALLFVLQTVGQENAGHLACLMDTLQILADHLPHWLVKPHIVFSHIRTIVDFLVCNVRTSGCGTDTDSLPPPSSHCLPSPKIYGHSSRPITVIKEQWRDLCAYFEQNA